MSHYHKIIFLLSLLVVGYGSEGVRPDSGFKSIHQHKYEAYQKATVRRDTISKSETVKGENELSGKRQVETIINLTLMNIILITLVIVLIIFLILHRRYRLRKE